MKTFQVHRLRALVEAVRAGDTIPERLLTICEAALDRELGIKQRAGQRQADFFRAWSDADAAGCARPQARRPFKCTDDDLRELLKDLELDTATAAARLRDDDLGDVIGRMLAA